MLKHNFSHLICIYLLFENFWSKWNSKWNWLNVLSQSVQWNGFSPVWMELAECVVTECALKRFLSCMKEIGWMSCHRVCSEMVSLLYEWNWLNVLSQSVHWNGFSQDSHLFLCEKGWNFLLWKQTFSWDNLIFESLIFQSWKMMHVFFCCSSTGLEVVSEHL